MRILFLAHRIPYPPNKGDKIRSFHQVRGLAARGHDVHVMGFADDPADLAHADALRRLCASAHVVPLHPARARVRAIGRLPRRGPLSLAYFDCRQMRHAVAQALDRVRPDAVVAFSSVMAQYVPPHLARRAIVDLVDVDSEKWRDYAARSGVPLSWLYRTEWHRLRTYEDTIVSNSGGTVVSTRRELALLQRPEADDERRRSEWPADARLHVVGNGVDLQYFRPGQAPSSSGATRLVFTGAMDYLPNVDGICAFVRDVLPLVRARLPQTELLIVGRNPTAAVRRLSRAGRVTVTGTVADVRPYLLAADVVVVPLRIARGIQNKVLEAMASGCAVVATPEGIAGLDVQPGRDLLVASSPAEFAAAALQSLADPDRRQELGRAARAYVETHHQWAPILTTFGQIVEAVVTAPRPA